MLSASNPVVVIVGAGVFGLSTAYHLLERGYTDVTVLDRAENLPAVDAAGTDMNKVVRSCYADLEYTRLARQAIQEWRKGIWQSCYHECGVLNFGDAYTEQSFSNDVKEGARVERLDSAASIRAQFPSDFSNSGKLGNISSADASSTRYMNHEGGWAEAERAVSLLMDYVKKRGVKVLPGKAVRELIRDEHGHTKGLHCVDGSEYRADVVVLALGSWTAGTFPSLQLKGKCLATGQAVATIQLTSEEAEEYQKTPVVVDFRTGFYVFPPTNCNVVKFAIHSAGFTHTVPGSTISTPRTIISHPNNGLQVPKSALKELRVRLRGVYPALAEKPFSGTRMCWCVSVPLQLTMWAHFRSVLEYNILIPNAEKTLEKWVSLSDWIIGGAPGIILRRVLVQYTDSPDGDWVIGRYPGDPGLFLATSGSGHAFKFLPIIGKLVVDVIEDKLDPKLIARFAVDREVKSPNGERIADVIQELDVGELCEPEDLMPTF